MANITRQRAFIQDKTYADQEVNKLCTQMCDTNLFPKGHPNLAIRIVGTNWPSIYSIHVVVMYRE